jgi:hypothetical protein
MASFMPQRISAGFGDAKPKASKQRLTGAQTGQKDPENANDHEQRARVHPAQPSYSVVVPAPELSSINVAVETQIGTNGAFARGCFDTPEGAARRRRG